MAASGSRGLGFESGVRIIRRAGTRAATLFVCIDLKLPATRQEALSGCLQRFGLVLIEYSCACHAVCGTDGWTSLRTYLSLLSWRLQTRE